MATFKVTKNADSGVASLCQAIASANSLPRLDNIVFKVIDVNLNSAILISDPVDITGNGAVITRTKSDRIFNISDGSQDTLFDVGFNIRFD